MFKSIKCEIAYYNKTICRWYKEGLPAIQNREDFIAKQLNSIGYMVGGWAPINMEGYPENTDISRYFNFDLKLARVPLNFEPFLKEENIEENDEYRIFIDKYGIKQKDLKKSVSMPQFLEYPVKNRSDFEKIKSLYTDDYEKRLCNNWVKKIENYRKDSYTILLNNDLWGFFGVLRQLMGIEFLSLIFYDDPSFIKEILKFYTDYVIKFWEYILKRVRVDVVFIWEDMAYNKASLISPDMFREFLLPYYKEITYFLRGQNIKNIFVDSDGNIADLISLWIEGGITGLFPMEVKSGMDIVLVRKIFPDLIIAGGINKMALAKDKSSIDFELEKAEYVLERGKYIPFIDHSIPYDISWENFKYYRNKINELIDKFNKH